MSKNQYYSVLKRPLITEKATELQETVGQYCFEVALGANKVEIRQAVEALFSVKVTDVRTSIVRGKTKRIGRTLGKRANWKKAVVKLHDGQEIDFFGEM